MEHTMASKPITYEPNSAAPAPRRSATVAWALPAWIGAVAARCARAIAKEIRIRRDTRALMLMSDRMPAARCVRAIANEVRIRRDTRALMLMSDRMLKDIGLSRTQIHGAVRFGRE
jgi:uncharacterized protein YjiS (DUF1127 family)